METPNLQHDRRQALSSLAACLAVPGLARLLPGSPGIWGSRPRGRPMSNEEVAAFLEAVRRGELPRVRQLLEEDRGLARSVDSEGRSAFVLARLGGHEEVASALLETGLELDIVEAVMAEDWERFEVLGQAHPELLNAVHPIGGTPLHAAARVGIRGFWRLRSQGCDPEARPEGGNGFTAARDALRSTHASWARTSLTDLCANGADVNARQRGGSSVLHGAVLRRDAVLVRLAIRKGADVAARDDQGRTARELASELGWAAGAQLLARHLELPRDHRASRFALDANREPIRRPDLSDVPQAHQSEVTGASHRDLERVRELVGADPRLVFSISTDDELAIEACAHAGTRPVIRYHLDQGAPLSLPTAVSLGDLESVAFWLERDPLLVHERGAHDFPVMWYAAIGGGSVEMAELLAHYDVPVDQESMGTTTLHWCVRRDDADLARWLIEHGAELDAVGYVWDRRGQTPLQVAQADGNERFATLLKQHGARG